MANPSPSQLQPVNENLFSLCLMIENEIVSARYFKMCWYWDLISNIILCGQHRIWWDERGEWLCATNSHLEGKKNWFPKGDELMKMWVAICIIFYFNLCVKHLFHVRHFASQWEYIMNRSQHVLSLLKELYLQVAFISFPHIWFIGNWSL